MIARTRPRPARRLAWLAVAALTSAAHARRVDADAHADTHTAAANGWCRGATGTPAATSRATLPATDTPGDATSTPAGESSRLILLALAGMSAAGLLLTRSVARKDDSAR